MRKRERLAFFDYLREHEEYWTSLRATRWAKVPAFNALQAVIKESTKMRRHKNEVDEMYIQGWNAAMNKVTLIVKRELDYDPR